MTANTIFQITCAIAAVGWIIILFASPFWISYDKLIVGIIVMLLAISYTSINIFHNYPGQLNDFTSFNGIKRLFSHEFLIAAAWVHFLAFDLLAAVWIKKNSVMHDISHLAIVPSLILTCMLGPLGFLIYLLTRWIKTKKYFAENFNPQE